MRVDVVKVNSFFKSADKITVDDVMTKIVLSDRQKEILVMYYIRKLDVGYIADKMNVSYSVIKKELNCIRKKVVCHV